MSDNVTKESVSVANETIYGFPQYGGWAPAPEVDNTPTDTEIRLRESAIGLTIEYFRGVEGVELGTFDAQLNRFYTFLQTGTLQPTATLNQGAPVNVEF